LCWIKVIKVIYKAARQLREKFGVGHAVPYNQSREAVGAAISPNPRVPMKTRTLLRTRVPGQRSSQKVVDEQSASAPYL
jgi:hypothetical protein